MPDVLDAIRTGLSWFLALFLIGWFLVSILNQHPRSRQLISTIVSYDVGGVVPIWTFFAPNPGDTDTHLLFRDRDADGRITSWREIRLIGRRRVVDLWNPRRRINKAIVDVVHDLTKRDSNDQSDDTAPGPKPVSKRRVLSFPYLLILNYVSRTEGDFGAIERQFAAVRTPGIVAWEHPDVLLVSAFHRLT